MSKRILSLVLVLALVLGSFSMAFADTAVTSAKTMTDVEGTQYEKAVVTLGKLKVLEGYGDGTFKPGNTITRAEFAAVASRIRGLETAAQNSKGTTEFKDVPASHWASGYVNVASKNGLIKGMGNGQFAPEAQITYEQAITMIVRALGYEYAAQSLGGYPVGYLSVASQEQLLKGINEGAQGTAATRGLVALLLNNALDIPKMVQVGYGDQARWVKSGTENTKALYLFEDLGLKQVSKVVVTKADSKKQQVTITATKDTPENFNSRGLKASKDFDYVGLEGMRVTAWFDEKAGELIVAKEDGTFTAKYDVVEKTTRTKDEVKLINANEKYDVASNVILNLSKLSDYSKANNTYAKVIIDEYGDIRQITAYNLGDKIVVKEVSKDLIKGYDRKEISDSKDYTIIKNGKEISAADLKDKDLLIYDSKEEVAVVITDIREGKIDTVYKEGFKFEGKTYDYVIDKDRSATAKVQYISADNLEDVDDNVLEEMQKNGEVKVYFSFDGKPLFIDGKAEEVASNYVMLESNSVKFDNRGTDYRTFDVLNSEGKVVKYEVKEADIDSTTNKIFAEGNLADWKAKFENAVVKDAKGNVTDTVVAKITTDASNKLTKVESMSKRTISSDVATDDTYLGGARLQSNTLVFMKDSENKVADYSVIKWADAAKEFKKVTVGDYYIFDGKVVAIYAKTTDGDTQTKDVVGVLKKSKETTSKSRYDVIVEINGKEVDYQAKKFTGIENLEDNVNKVVVLKVTKEGNELRGYSVPTGTKVTVKSATSGTLTDSNKKTYDVEGQYYNNSLRSTIKAGDVVGEEVTLYFQPGSDRYVQVVQLGEGTTPVSQDTLKYAYTKGGTVYLTINDKDYEYGGVQTLAQLKSLEGKVVNFEVRNGVVVSVEAKTVTPDPTNEKPVINVEGSKTITLNVGDTFVAPKYSANDKEDGNITSSVVVTGLDKVDTTKARSYTITYNVKDSKGLAADAVVVVVEVKEKETPDAELKVTKKGSFNIMLGKVTVDVNDSKLVVKALVDGEEAYVMKLSNGKTIAIDAGTKPTTVELVDAKGNKVTVEVE